VKGKGRKRKEGKGRKKIKKKREHQSKDLNVTREPSIWHRSAMRCDALAVLADEQQQDRDFASVKPEKRKSCVVKILRSAISFHETMPKKRIGSTCFSAVTQCDHRANAKHVQNPK
jgi:hypothetical protein